MNVPLGRDTRTRAARLVLAGLVLTGCSTAGQVPGAAPMGDATSAALPQEASTPASTTAEPAPLQPPRAVGITWHPEGTQVDGRPVTYVAVTDGGAVGLLWIDPTHVSFRLVPGRKVPEGGPSLPADNRPSTWVPRMVAAFNGGFLLGDGVGGYYYAHRMVRPLVPGLAALEITSDGRLTVGRWGRDETLVSTTVAVRQNLPLLVDGFRSRTSPTDTARTWGLANGGLWTANRSAVGELPDGALVYAYGHEVRPATIAAALVSVGVERAMVLDMNKSWPGGFVYWHTTAGPVGRRVQPQEYHSPSVYYARYTKDFIVVLLR
jgi:hypothetical protein